MPFHSKSTYNTPLHKFSKCHPTGPSVPISTPFGAGCTSPPIKHIHFKRINATNPPRTARPRSAPHSGPTVAHARAIAFCRNRSAHFVFATATGTPKDGPKEAPAGQVVSVGMSFLISTPNTFPNRVISVLKWLVMAVRTIANCSKTALNSVSVEPCCPRCALIQDVSKSKCRSYRLNNADCTAAIRLQNQLTRPR